MSKSKRLVFLFSILMLILAVGMVACQETPEPAPQEEAAPAESAEEAAPAESEAAAEEQVPEAEESQVEDAEAILGDGAMRIALVREIGDGAFMARYLAGAQSMADELGIELIESNARGDQAQMVTMVENAIQQQVDAIIIDHGRTDTLQPVIEQALAAGIQVVTFDLVTDNPDVSEIEQDDMLIGFMLTKQLATDFGGQANLVYVNVGGFAPLDKRDRSYQDFLWRYQGLNEVAHIGAVSNSTAADTQTQMEATLKENPETNAVIAMWDEFAKGVVRAVTQSGAEDISVYSVDVTDEDIQMMIEPGSPWAATVATDSYNVGRLAVRAAAAKVIGENVDKYLLVAPALITQEFLLENGITNMDELVEAMPVLGESNLMWYDWMFDAITENGYDLPTVAGAPGGDDAGEEAMVDTSNVELPEAVSGDPVRIALVREIGDGAFMARYLAGAQSMADELGIELIESNARGDQAQMVTMVENAIQQQVDAIIIDHGRTDTLQPVIEQALAAGIQVVTFDLVTDNPDVSEIEQDDMLIGFMLTKQLATDFGGQANLVYVNVGGFAPLDKRDRSYQNFLWRYQGLNEVAHIGIVSNSTAADTQTQMEATLKENPETNAVIAMWDEFAKGVVRAVTQSGAEDISVYSVDVTDEDIQMMIEPGSPWAATVATDSYNVGRLAVRAALAKVAGEEVDKYLLVAPALITQEFLLENGIANMDELVEAMPVLGESTLVWYDWMYKLQAE